MKKRQAELYRRIHQIGSLSVNSEVGVVERTYSQTRNPDWVSSPISYPK